jgi:hypothetical protein
VLVSAWRSVARRLVEDRESLCMSSGELEYVYISDSAVLPVDLSVIKRECN